MPPLCPQPLTRSRTKPWFVLLASVLWVPTPSRAEEQAAGGRLTSPGGKTDSAQTGHGAANYASRLREVRQEITSHGLRGRFTVLAQRPFVVVGDEWQGDVRRRARNRIQWATDLLQQEYFPRYPRQIISIWLFRDRKSYVQNTIRLLGELPDTPFGFYTARHRALVMNISTGEGTLVHEMVHAFIEGNFPECPPWLNEGLGSLYEMVGKRRDRIYGYVNWRLPGLQRAIRARRVPPLRELMALDPDEFYRGDVGTHYAMSRYLLYYLQEKDLLQRYYRDAVKSSRSDPTGYSTFMKVLGVRDAAAFQRGWDGYVMKLRYKR